MAMNKEFLNGAKAIGSLKNSIQMYLGGSTEDAIKDLETSKILLIEQLKNIQVMADKEFTNGNKAKESLKNAIQLHSDGKDEEATDAFESHKKILEKQLQNVKIECQKKEYLQRHQEYVDSPEDLNGFLKEEIEVAKIAKVIEIKEGSYGYSYESLFGKYLNLHVEWVEVYDPYVRTEHQVENFQKLCDLVVKKKIPVTKITLTTGKDREADKIEKQKHMLFELQKELMENHKIKLEISYSDVLHDREIRLSTGWVIQLGRGLDYFHRFERSINDLDQWPCRETNVIIYHKDRIQKKCKN